MSNTPYYRIFDAHPDPMWVYDTETLRFLAVNDTALRRYGYSRDEFLGMTLTQIRPDTDVPTLLEYVSGSVLGPDKAGIWRHRISNGDIILAEISTHPLDFEGRAAMLVLAREVRECRQEDEAVRLRRSDTLLSLAGKIARIGGWAVDLKTRRVSWSDEICLIHEMPPGTSPTLDEGISFYAPKDRPRIREVFEACARDGKPYDEELQILTASGNPVWVRAIGQAARAEDGSITHVCGAFQDISERKKAEAEALAYARRMTSVLESITDAFFAVDCEWRFTYVNGEAEKVLQRTRAALIGSNLWAEFPEAVDTVFYHEYYRAITEQVPVKFEEYYPPLGKWFYVHAYPSHDGLTVYFQDTTERRSAREQINLLESSFAKLNDIVIITEADPIDEPGPRILFVNDAFERRTGYCREEALGRSPRLLQGPKTDRAELERIRAALQGGVPVRAELINYTKNGEELWLDLNIFPVTDERGRVAQFVSVERDVSERKRSQEALRESEERFRIVSKATADAIWDWDLKEDSVWWNEGILNLFGHDPDTADHTADFWRSRVHPDDAERVLLSLHEAITGSGDNWNGEYRFVRSDGTYAQVIDRGFVIRDDQGGAIRMVGSMTDITDRQEMEEKLRQSQRLDALGQLTGGIAHDFNNLLTVILGSAETLVEGLPEGSPLQPVAAVTRTAAERGAELTGRLLAFGRRQALEPKPTDVGDLLQGMEGLLRRTLGEEIDIDLDRTVGLAEATVDPPQLEGAVLNLCLNARDAMPSGGRLSIRLGEISRGDAPTDWDFPPGRYVVIAVSDTGTGMQPDTKRRAFEPFFTTKEVGRGTGLGLSMVYGFAKQSGGHVELDSEVGLGTVVRMYLPAATESERRTRFPTEKDYAAGGDETILVVEDNELVREHVSAQLGTLGYRVIAAGDGPQALVAIKEHPEVDLLFTDVVMPGGMSGRELAREVRLLRSDLPVLFTSGYVESAMIHEGRLDPGVQLLSKPYQRKDLADKIRSALANSGCR